MSLCAFKGTVAALTYVDDMTLPVDHDITVVPVLDL